jgi:pimeloyl-ACP methyl ester carboxylesterase
MPLVELDDVTLHYQTRGEGSSVIGVMGFGLDQRFWAGQIPTITAQNTFITFDNRGTGTSTGPLPRSLREMASDAVRLLDSIGIDTTIVFGASMGGAVAQHMALEYPDRVRALILAVTWARPIEYMRREAELVRSLLAAAGEDAFVEASILHLFTPQFFEMGRDAIEQMIRAFSGGGAPPVPTVEVLTAQLDAITAHDTLAELHRISCPTLVVGGRFDMTVPFFASEEIARAIPGAELEAFDSGHGLMLEQMDAFNTRLEKFLVEVEQQARS